MAENLELLKKLNVSAVLTVAKDVDIKYDEKQDQVKYHQVYEIIDEEKEDISQFFEGSYNFIEKHIKERNVLLHCAAGLSRSASCVIAYLMRKYGLTFDEAHKYLQVKRNLFGGPNDGFIKQL